MIIRDKILQFCKINRIEQQEFADKIGMSKATFSNKITGKRKFNEDDFLSIKQAYPRISFDALFDNDNDNIMSNDEFKCSEDNEFFLALKKIHRITNRFNFDPK
ncbi:helix-turn-helix domain-containing protein [Riemerella columbina]|uniref:helix-turn-helix domain-containing protein n=1 Tax=Riemerella columbina TaxID=103810 RepID=UPI00036ED0E9|nr:helix-turn-helix transcriptional regulator [Riemerella columbina]